MSKPKYLYHGSKYKVNKLIPHTAKGNPAENGAEYGVYAFAKMEAAQPFALSILPFSNGGLSIYIDDDTSITTVSAGIFISDSIGYIYKLPSETFVQLDERQWISRVAVKPVEVFEFHTRDYLDKVILTGSAKEVKQIADSISPCGLVCKMCHLSEICNGCTSENNCCGKRKSLDGCFQYNCCKEKGINGCWQCGIAPCDKGMFSEGHDLRIKAFITYIKENGRDRLADRLYHNTKKVFITGMIRIMII